MWIEAKDEREPFPAFLETCSDMELVMMQHEARKVGDSVTLNAVLMELKRRVSKQWNGLLRPTPPTQEGPQ